MAEKTPRTMGKSELLMTLGERDARIATLEKTVKDLQERNNDLIERNRELLASNAAKDVSFGPFENAGSIAEASLQVSNIFTAAQESADKYLEGIRDMEKNARHESERIITEAHENANALIVSANRECSDREAREKEYVDTLWHDMQERLLQFYDKYSELGELFSKTKFPTQLNDVAAEVSEPPAG